jgi:hypothetical protein
MRAAIIALSLVAAGVSAQTLKDIKLDQSQVLVGQNVTATIDLEVKDNNVNCGMRVKWGDGSSTDIRLDDKNSIPNKVVHTYAKPGDYTVAVDSHKVKASLGCLGKDVTAKVKVSAPPPPPPPPAPVAAAPVAAASVAKVVAGPSCPEGWKLDPKSVVKKTGAYGCTAKAGTAAPEKKPVCPGDLTYYENSKKGMLGCKP